MFSLQVNHLEVYREQQQGSIRPGGHWVSFTISGMRSFKARGINLVKPGPFFLIGGAGMHVTFDFGPDRENWVFLLQTNDLRLSRRPGFVEIRWGNGWIPVPCVTLVDPTEVPGWQHEYFLMRELVADPLPQNRLRLDLAVRNIFRYVLNKHAPAKLGELPVSQFCALIEKPDTASQSLAALSRQTGYSPQHLRELFRKEYGLAPAAYRMRYRMKEAMEHVTNSDLSVKEMSFRLRFRHVSHFSLAFKKAFGISPKQAIAMFRR